MSGSDAVLDGGVLVNIASSSPSTPNPADLNRRPRDQG
jgi:hypothetical protein